MRRSKTFDISYIGRWSQKLSSPIISEGLLLLAVVMFWYEGVLPTYNLAGVLLVLSLVLADKSKIKINKSTVYLILFSLVALFSGFFASLNGIGSVTILMGWALFAQFVIALSAGQGVANPKRLAINIMFVSLPMIIIGAYQFITNQATSRLWVSPSETSLSTRSFAFFGSPNVLGAVLAIVALVSLGLLLDVYKDSPSRTARRTVLEPAPMAIISVLAVVVLAFTFSRSAWIGFAAGLILIVFIKNWKRIFFAPAFALLLLLPQIRERLLVIFTSGYWLDSSLDGRLWALNNGFHIWAKHPILGSGPGTYGGKLALNNASPVYLEGIQRGYVALYFTDNQWLQLLVQTGLVGIVLFALFVVNMFAELLRGYNVTKSWTTLGIAGAFVSFLVTGFFGNVLEFGAIAVPMGIMLGVANGNK